MGERRTQGLEHGCQDLLRYAAARHWKNRPRPGADEKSIPESGAQLLAATKVFNWRLGFDKSHSNTQNLGFPSSLILGRPGAILCQYSGALDAASLDQALLATRGQPALSCPAAKNGRTQMESVEPTVHDAL